MTRKTTKGTKPDAKMAKRLSLSKQTLKDLSVPAQAGKGPKGGRIPATDITCISKGCPPTKIL